VSRWGDDGEIVQADFSQLEVIGAAFLSGDPKMYEDILAGIDSHSQSASWMYPHTYEEVREGYLAEDEYFCGIRKKSKGPRFQLQYGARAKGIAEKCGITLEQANAFLKQYYGRYKRLAQWQEENFEIARCNREFREKTVIKKDGTEHTTHWQVCKLPSITGRVYTFREYETPDFIRERDGIEYQIKDTQVKNYPSQGFATGDVVPMMLGKTYRRLLTGPMSETALLIGTIHDSILFDCHKSAIDAGFCLGIKKFLERTPEFIEQTWGFKFDLPLYVDVEKGRTWASMRRAA